MARRSRNAAAPTSTMERRFLRASCAKKRSARAKKREPSLGRAKAPAKAIAVRQPSIIMSEAPCCGAADEIISQKLTYPRTAGCKGSGLRSLGGLRVVSESDLSTGGVVPGELDESELMGEEAGGGLQHAQAVFGAAPEI